MNSRSSLGHLPADDKWTFDETVTAVFDDMLARSIPQIDAMREIVTAVASRFVRPDTEVVDLGCACGEALARIIDRSDSDRVRFTGIDSSESMVEASRARFRKPIEEQRVSILHGDICSDYPGARASLTLCVLTLQFIPIERRAPLLKEVATSTVPGGALILVEKILGEDAIGDKLLADLYYDHKRTMGYSPHEIERKRRSLEGVLVPLTSRWNEELLRHAGFDTVQTIWRSLNFCAWVAIKS